MLGIYDRYLIRIFFRAFLICFISLVGLYVVIDAFTNLDEFDERSHGLLSILADMAKFYSFRVTLFFDQLAGIITTIAAMFALSWIQRTNELVPLLTAGVPIYRVITPVILAAVGVNGMAVINQEAVIPRIGRQLQMTHDDPGDKTLEVRATYDPRGVLISGVGCYRQDQAIRPAFITLPPNLAGLLVELRVTEAKYVPPGTGEPAGGWLLVGVEPTPMPVLPGVLQPLGPDRYFLHTPVTFDQLSRPKHWFHFATTGDLLAELRLASSSTRAEMAVLLHSRLTRPLSNLTLLLLALPFVLSGSSRGMLWLMGGSLAISVVFQAFCFLTQRMGSAGLLPPTLAAWLPVLLFGTLAITLFDSIRS